MFDSATKLKNFIIWCQENKVKSFKNKDIEFELSDLGMLPETTEFNEIKLDDQKAFSDFDAMSKEEQEELLFWSANHKG